MAGHVAFLLFLTASQAASKLSLLAHAANFCNSKLRMILISAALPAVWHLFDLILDGRTLSCTPTRPQVDSSGFNLTYTSRLRNATLGVLTLGNTDMRIPANNASFTALANICPAECTGKRVLQPVTLVSNLFLMSDVVSEPHPEPYLL